MRHYILALHKPLSAAEQAYMSVRNSTYRIMRPSTGAGKPSGRSEINDVYVRVTREAAKAGWERQHATALTTCMHGPTCKHGRDCAVGRRKRTMHILAGSLLPVWSRIESVMRHMASSSASKAFALKVTRIRTADGQRVVGIAVASEHVVKRIKAAIDQDVAAASGAAAGAGSSKMGAGAGASAYNAYVASRTAPSAGKLDAKFAPPSGNASAAGQSYQQMMTASVAAAQQRHLALLAAQQRQAASLAAAAADQKPKVPLAPSATVASAATANGGDGSAAAAAARKVAKPTGPPVVIDLT
jgi:hypothetical protein